MIAIALAALVAADDIDVKVIDVDVENRLVLVDAVTTLEPSDSTPPNHCRNEELGGKTEALHVVGLGKKDEEIEIAGEIAPCPTKTTVKKARDAARVALAARHLRLDRTDLKAVKLGKAGALHVEDSDHDVADDGMVGNHVHSVFAGDALLLEWEQEYGRAMGGNVTVAAWSIEQKGVTLLLEAITGANGRSSHTDFRLFGPLVLPSNGVDVAGLAAVKLTPACAASVAANAALIDNVALTVAHALGKDTAITKSKAERPASVVYAAPACTDVAKALAAKIPGGATVDKLTWKTTGGIVVALGATAAPK